jgi:hypothetical protein
MLKSDIIEEIDFGNDSDDPNYQQLKTSSFKLNNMDLDFKDTKKELK